MALFCNIYCKLALPVCYIRPCSRVYQRSRHSDIAHRSGHVCAVQYIHAGPMRSVCPQRAELSVVARSKEMDDVGMLKQHGVMAWKRGIELIPGTRPYIDAPVHQHLFSLYVRCSLSGNEMWSGGESSRMMGYRKSHGSFCRALLTICMHVAEVGGDLLIRTLSDFPRIL